MSKKTGNSKKDAQYSEKGQRPNYRPNKPNSTKPIELGERPEYKPLKVIDEKPENE